MLGRWNWWAPRGGRARRPARGIPSVGRALAVSALTSTLASALSSFRSMMRFQRAGAMNVVIGAEQRPLDTVCDFRGFRESKHRDKNVSNTGHSNYLHSSKALVYLAFTWRPERTGWGAAGPR